jgi:hypothetical protein
MSFFKKETDEIIELDLWGGSQIYEKKTKKYIIVRDCGLLSNLTVVLYGVFVLTRSGYEIDDIEITMTDYFRDKNIYPLIFGKKSTEFSFDDISKEELDFFFSNCIPSICGLGLKHWTTLQSTKENFNLNITKKIIDKFFTFNQNVYISYYKMLQDKSIKENEYVFVWARKTDKVEETKVPEAITYYEYLKNNNLIGEKIFIQTDDSTMFNDFKDLNFEFDYFEEIPFAKSYSFHRNISQLEDNLFFETYNITKEEYIIKMMCVVLLAANAKKTLIYPGNPTTVVPMYKNTFENCVLFKNDLELF